MSAIFGDNLDDQEPEPGALCMTSLDPPMKNAEESCWPGDEIDTAIKILLCLFVIGYLITGIVFLVHYKYLCKGMSQMWIFCLVMELVPICYAFLVEYLLPSWNPALFWKRLAVRGHSLCIFISSAL